MAAESKLDLWSVWFACHEDVGEVGYFTDQARAERVLAQAETRLIGRTTSHGDTVQRVGCTKIEIDKLRWPKLMRRSLRKNIQTRRDAQ